MSDELTRQLAFIVEIDRLKMVQRRTYIVGGRRQENSAEHSWHLAVMALVLASHANEGVDLDRVIRLVLVHDLVEIDAGDTYAYDATGQADQQERERAAAARLFGLLPEDQRRELQALWEEFDARQTPEARFANALDRFMPFLHNIQTGGAQWRKNGVTAAQVRRRMAPVADGSKALHGLIEKLLDEAVAGGLLSEDLS